MLYRTADQCLCFRYIASTITILPKSEISSLLLSSVAAQPICVGPGQKPRRQVFLRRSSFKGCVTVPDFITETSSSTGILLDPYYTGKGAMGMVRELSLHPERFKGKRVLFIHTGIAKFAFEPRCEKTCL